MKSKPFPHAYQLHPMDCGPVCLKMIADYYGINFNPLQMDSFPSITREGISMSLLADEVKKLGFTPTTLRMTLSNLEKVTLPVILHWDRCHFVVLYQIINGTYHIADPDKGIVTLRKAAFLTHWRFLPRKGCEEGIVMQFARSNSTD